MDGDRPASRSGDRRGARPGALAVCGDSAGGALAAVVARRARDHGLALALQLLVFPVADADPTRPSYAENEAYGPSAASLDWFWSHYVGPGGDRTHPDAAPLRATDLAGLCPAHVITAGCDTLRDEGEAYGDALAAAGVAVTRTRYEGQIHGFFRLGAAIDRASACLDECGAVLRGAFAEAA
ncbi:MAG: alpha/beta hydrolase fold domain-containing protein [Thermoleophilia bacterium]